MSILESLGIFPAQEQMNDCKSEIHKLFQYEVHEKLMHLEKRMKKKMHVLKSIKHRLTDLEITIRSFYDFIQSQWREFEQVGSIGSKKAAMLAELENEKHQSTFNFLIGLFDLIQESLQNDFELLNEYNKYA